MSCLCTAVVPHTNVNVAFLPPCQHQQFTKTAAAECLTFLFLHGQLSLPDYFTADDIQKFVAGFLISQWSLQPFN